MRIIELRVYIRADAHADASELDLLAETIKDAVYDVDDTVTSPIADVTYEVRDDYQE